MDGECPLFLPLIVKERQAVQKGLLDRGVESVAIWSDEQHDLTESVTEDVRHLRQTVMEIPVYQGLTRKDLEHLVDVISSVEEGVTFRVLTGTIQTPPVNGGATTHSTHPLFQHSVVPLSAHLSLIISLCFSAISLRK